MYAAQPQLACQLAYDRQSGRLQGPLTSSYLKPDLAGQDSHYAAQLTNAIDYLEKREREREKEDEEKRRMVKGKRNKSAPNMRFIYLSS